MTRISFLIIHAILTFLCVANIAIAQDRPPGTAVINAKKVPLARGSFGYDLTFLRRYHKDLLLLGDDTSGAQIIVLPAYQARVMTSTAEGSKGFSFGWINHEFIAAKKPAEHINVFGGEERIWLGPEGGQYSIFFKKGSEFTFDNWFVPKELDTAPFKLQSATKTEARFTKDMQLKNYSGTTFNLTVDRTIRLLDKASINKALGINLPATVKAVGFESKNSIINKGRSAWQKNSGLLSIWILSMLNASPQTTIAVPYIKGDSAQLGKVVTDDYFGKVPTDRLADKNGLLLLKADAAYRSKMGVSPKRAKPIMASYDAAAGVLTIALFSLPEGVVDYVNSLWKQQDDPFNGDAANAYNDGPMDGKQLGQFYELESSSPAAALLPGQSMQHIHRTFHFKGSQPSLDVITKKLLGVGVDEIKL